VNRWPVKSFEHILNAVVLELQRTPGTKVKLTLDVEANAEFCRWRDPPNCHAMSSCGGITSAPIFKLSNDSLRPPIHGGEGSTRCLRRPRKRRHSSLSILSPIYGLTGDSVPVIRTRLLAAEDITRGPKRGPLASYQAIKAAADACLLFYRVGRPYELLFADASIAAKLLDLPLATLRARGWKRIAMCRVPVWEDDYHINLLVAAGHRVAVLKCSRQSLTAAEASVRSPERLRLDKATAMFSTTSMNFISMSLKTDLNAAEERWHELTDARWDAQDAVLNAQPRSHAGVLALQMFTAEYLADDMETNTCKIVSVIVNAARSMRAIAGDTRLLTISKELAEVLSGDRVCAERAPRSGPARRKIRWRSPKAIRLSRGRGAANVARSQGAPDSLRYIESV
jgi:MutS domain I